ncbi:reverse transcriptase domain-containing protein [Tanacetum coccineum]
MIQSWQKIVRQKISQSFSPNLKISFPSLGDDEGAEGPLIIEAEIGGHQVHRMCVDGGSSFEILYEHCFNRLRPEIRNQMIPATTSLVGFSGEIKWPLGQITLLVKIGDDEHSTSTWMDFMIVRSTSPYNGIIGRPGLRKIHAVPSTTHGMIKFPVTGGILTLRSSKIIPIECAMVSGPEDQPLPVNKVKEERVKVAINPEHPEQTVMIGSNLTEKARVKMCNLLQRSLDVFAWTPADMTGVPRHIAEHRLNVREGCQPIRQKKRGQAAERNIAINDEVSKLVAAGIMREVHYHDWLSNPVMVKKHDDSWRMCVDFKDLNKACPKDGYPLPEIDWKVESLCGFPFKCFLDAYKGYHQIQMAEEDEEKTAFITNQGIFCYTKMPFGLRNAGATYQRLVDKAFHGQIGRNLEVYVDDLVIKSRTEDEIVRDIEETFKTLRKINMKLNPKKCTFGVEEGMFLGYQVNTKGIKICPDKVDAVLSLQSPKCLKDVQKLNGKLASLNRREAAFRQMKEHIAKLPMPTALEEHEELIIYLAASKEAVSVVLMTEREARKMPVYFVITGTPRAWKVSVKGQVLADFIVERPEEEGQDDSTKEEEPLPHSAEYEALIAGLWIAKKMGVQNLQVNVDSKLVANQVNGTYIAKETDMIKYLEKNACGTRSYVGQALRIGYYWPTMHKDARALIKACQECQVHKPVLRNPQKKLNSITSPWPFYKWGLDIAGPFPKGPGKVKFLIVAMDYFTKWIEAKPVETITGNQVKQFVWENIMCRFGLPGEIISDNGKQFQDNPFKDWLSKDNKNWMEEISHVLWAHRTMVKSSNGDTPFSLTYGMEAIIPTEIGMPTFRTAEVDVAENDEALKINLELLEEKREQAAIREAKSKRQMEKYYNAKVRNISFKPGDLVYRNNEASHAEDTGKLGPKWEGPYEVTEALGKGSYRLKDRNGKELPQT